MTIEKKTMEKIREMYAEGFPKRQISQKLGVAVNTVAKYIKEKPTDERKKVNGIPQINQLEEELQIAGLKPEIRWRLLEVINFLEAIEKPGVEAESLLCQLYLLREKLENASDIDSMKWVETKSDEIIQQVLKSRKEKIDRDVREKAKREKEAQEKYDRQYNMLKRELGEVIKEANTILLHPVNPEEIDEIAKKTLPYGRDILDIASPGRFGRVLMEYGLSQVQASTVLEWWRKRIFKYA